MDRFGITKSHRSSWLNKTCIITKWYDELTKKQRDHLCYEKRVQSQLLYGEEVIVDQIEGKWAKIIAVNQPSKKDERGYPGWVPLTQLKLVSQDWREPPIALVTNEQTILYDSNKLPFLELSYGTYLPVLKQQESWIKVRTPEGEGWFQAKNIKVYNSIKDLPQGNGQSIVKSAEQFLKLPYFWGGMSAFGYDCSGFAYTMHKMNGYRIPRDASDQALQGKQVAFNELKIGDLLFFEGDIGKGNINHVGIYYGNGQMIHSSISSTGIEVISLAGSRYESKLCEARRYYQEEST
ncbi:C40 family peptidase [Piscibacillus salipiscarius]|uniref:C40 family peptidase n=1 Tax=Piscibacillus salipiscarius TaxID=299480 RepID=UPI000AE65B85|nr:C40 family peptidase [Piscibacillus salipiscarius]